MSSDQLPVLPMPGLVCRMLAALSIPFAQSLPAYAVGTLRGPAWLDYRAIARSMENQRLAENRVSFVTRITSTHLPIEFLVP